MIRNRALRPSRTLAGVVGALALAGSLGLSGCGAGQLSQTANQISAVNGVSGEVGSILLRDTRIGYPPQPASAGALYQRDGAAPVEGTLINQGAVADRLVKVSSPFAGNAVVTGDATLAQNLPLIVSVGEVPVPPGARPLRIELTGLTTPVRSGVPVPVTFTFERAGSVTLEVPIGTPPEGGSLPERQDSEAAEGSATPTRPAVSEQPGSQQPGAGRGEQTGGPGPVQVAPTNPGGGS